MKNLYLLVSLMMIAIPELAHAEPISGAGNWVMDLLTNGLARIVAVIACAAFGYAALAGYMQPRWAAGIVIGIVFIFGGGAIVDAISSAANAA